MNLLIATNSKFLRPAKVMLYSFFVAHPDAEVDVYLPYHDLTPEEVSNLSEYVAAFKGKMLHPFDVGSEFSKRVKAFGNFSVEIFYRILAIEMLPAELDRILYMDVDTVVLKNLEELYDTDITGYPFAVCEDISSYFNETADEMKMRIGLRKETPYFNSGIMLFNLEYLRKNNIEDMILEEIYDKFDKYPYPDQDVMNRMFEDKLLYVDWDRYNCHPAAYFLNTKAAEKGELRFATYQEIRNASARPEEFAKTYVDITARVCANASIIHYVGASKPWNSDYDDAAAFFKPFAAVYNRFEREVNEYEDLRGRGEVKGRILVLKGISRYEVLRRAADEVAKGFRACGYAVDIVDATKPDFDLSILMSDKYAFCFVPQAFIFDIKLKNGASLISAIKTPVVGWIFDDCLYHYERVLGNRYGHVKLCSVDGAADRIVHDMGLGTNPVYTVLHGGFKAHGSSEEYIEKTIDVLCPATLGKMPEWRKIPSETERMLANDAIELWKMKPELSARQALGIICERYGEKLDGGLLYSMSEAVLYIMDMMRYLCRKSILQSLIRAGFNIHLIGEMQESEHYPANVTVHGPMEIDEVAELIARSKVLINPFPTVYEGGAHERIFTALLNRTVCFTPRYPFVEQLLGNRIEYIDMDEVDLSIGRMKAIVEHFDDYRDRLHENMLYALANHTWEKRAEEILKIWDGRLHVTDKHD